MSTPDVGVAAIRDAKDEDAAAIALLLTELGYPADPADIERRLLVHRSTGGIAVVAGLSPDAAPVALATMSIFPALHVAGQIAHITSFVVDTASRRRGIGRALLKELESRARAAGCVRLLVTSGLQRADAHAFYQSAGLPRTGLRFAKQL